MKPKIPNFVAFVQYSLPQFVEVEDQILPHLTIKQFLMLVGCAVLGFIYWAIFGIGVISITLFVLTLAVVVPLAFVKFNGRPIIANIPGLIHYFSMPKRRVFIHTASFAISEKIAKVLPKPEEIVPPEPPTASRLKKLAYFLDEKAAEEERLLRTGEYSRKWLNEV